MRVLITLYIRTDEVLVILYIWTEEVLVILYIGTDEGSSDNVHRD